MACRAKSTIAARSVSRSTRRRAWPSSDSTSSTAANFDQSGGAPVVADIDESLRNRGPQLGQVASADDVTVVDDDDVLAQVLDQTELVAGEQHRRAGRRDLGEQVGHAGHGEGIEAGERLVEHQQVGLVDQGGDQLDTLLVAVREAHRGGRSPGRRDRAARARCRRCDPPSRLVCAAQPAEIDELVPHPHVGVQAPLLRHVAEPRPLRSADGGATPPHTSRVELDQAEHRPHRGGLPGSVRPEEACEPPWLGGERARVQRHHGTELLARSVEAQHSAPPAPNITRRE